MNNAKIWLAVNPTVGVPLFLGAVAVGSFAVHVSVLTNTSWVSDFLSGQEIGSGDRAAIETPVVPASADGMTIYQPNTLVTQKGSNEATLVLPDGRTAKVVFKDPVRIGALEPAAFRRQ